MVVVLPHLPVAVDARNKLLTHGYMAVDIVLLTGSEFTHLVEDLRRDAGMWSRFTKCLSRIIGTEELQLDIDLEHANRGAAFLAVYCPDEGTTNKLCDILKPLGPLSMLRYSSLAVERLV